MRRHIPNKYKSGKLEIIASEQEYTTNALRKLPEKCRGVKFVTTGALLGATNKHPEQNQ